MRFSHWLRPLIFRLNPTRDRRNRRRPIFRPRIERLEDRTVPSTVSWINPAGGDWDTPSNWSGGAVPGANDDVVIDIAGQNNFTVTHTSAATYSVHSLQINGDTLNTSGDLNITGTFTNNGSLVGMPGTQLTFGDATTTSASSIQGYNVTFDGTANLAGSFAATHALDVEGAVTITGTVESLGALTVGSNSTLDLSAATLAPGSTDLPSLSINGGTLIASANWTVSGLFSSDSRLEAGNGGSGSLTAAGGADLYGSNDYLIGYTLVIPQGQTATADDITHLYNGAVLDNQGTLTLDGIGAYGYGAFVYDGSNALLKNEGTIYTNQSSYIYVPINSPGDIIAENGSLGLGAGNSTFGGQIDATNATGGLYFQGQVDLTPTSSVGAAAVYFGNAQVAGSYSATSTNLFESNVTVTGTVESLGALTISAGSATLDLSAATLAPGSTDLPSLNINNGGILIASADWTVSGLFSLNGRLEAGNGGTGSLTAAGGADLYGPNYLIGYTLVIPQGQSATVDDITELYDCAVLDNQGTLTLEGTGRYGYTALTYDGSNALLKNEGTLYTNLDSRIYVPINSPGDIIADNGSLGLGYVNNVPPLSTTSTFSGRIDATNATGGLYFEGQVTLAPTSSVDAAAVNFSSGNAQVAGSYSATSTDLFASDVTVTGTVESLGALTVGSNSTLDLSAATLAPGSTDLPSLSINGGTLIASADWTVSGLFTSDSRLEAGNGGSGSLTAAGGADLYGSNDYLIGYTLVIPQGQTATADDITHLYNGAVLDNQGTLTLDGIGAYGYGALTYDGSNALLKNEGTLYTNLDSRIYVPFTNSGSVTVQSGTLNLSGGYLQTAGSTTLAGGSLAGELNFQGGVLTGSGTIAGDVTNGGQVIPGSPLGVLEVQGNYSQSASGSLRVLLGGLTPGTQSAELQGDQSIALGGTLNLTLAAGFTPQVGNTFTILKNTGSSAVANTFAGLAEGATFVSSGYQFKISYVGGTGHDVTVTVTKVATSTTLTASVNPSLLNQAVTFSAAITPAVQANGTPTGTVQFQVDGVNVGSPVTLSGGSASFSTSTLGAGSHTITAVYSGDSNFLGSSTTLTQSVHYTFNGFLPPLSNGLAFAVNRTIPIKFTLSDYNGNAITSLSAVTALQIFNSQGVDVLGGSGLSGLSVTGGTYSYSWHTKGLPAGSYTISVTLADGTPQTKTIQLTAGGSSAGLVTDGSGGTATAGALLGGEVDLYVDNSNGDLTSDELNRIQDAVNSVDATIAPYGVVINEVTDPTQANVTMNMDTTSALGGLSQGVLGCTTNADQVTMIQGWNWYAGADPTQVGSGQYDFETAVVHELGHVLGLGHSGDSTSVMYASLATGTANRALVTADLNVPDSDSGPCALHAAPAVPRSGTSNGPGLPAPSSTSVPGNGSASSGVGQMFAELTGFVSFARNAYQAELSALWQQADALALQRLDALWSMEAGAMGVSKDTLMRDMLFASHSAS